MKSALEQALDSLARRAMTRQELEKRLRAKEYSDQQIIDAMRRIMEWGYIDDRRLALDYCQTRRQRYSRRRIREELRRRGVDAALIEEALDVYSVEEEFKQCLALAEQLWQQEKLKPDREARRPKGTKTEAQNISKLEDYDEADGQRSDQTKSARRFHLEQKVGRKLLYRGYPYELIHAVLKQIEGKEE